MANMLVPDHSKSTSSPPKVVTGAGKQSPQRHKPVRWRVRSASPDRTALIHVVTFDVMETRNGNELLGPVRPDLCVERRPACFIGTLVTMRAASRRWRISASLPIALSRGVAGRYSRQSLQTLPAWPCSPSAGHADA